MSLGTAPTFKRPVAGRSMPLLCNRWDPRKLIDQRHRQTSGAGRLRGKQGNATQ